MLNLNDLSFFVAAVEHGGFAAAARRLGLPKSTISKRVSTLEDGLGARLIHRTSRSFTLTELGRDFYEHARAALIEAEAAEAVVRRRQAEPSGTVRMTVSIPVAQLYLAEWLPQLAQKYPRLLLQVDVSDRLIDVLQEGIDIAIRSHFSPLPDSGLVQRRLMVEPIVLVASPDYLKRHDVPQFPYDLQHHDGLLSSSAASNWTLFHPSGESAQVTPHVAMIANESTVLVNAVLADLGITCLPERMCSALIESAKLVRVLPEWNAGSVTTTLMMQHRRGQLPSVRTTVEFLVERFREMSSVIHVAAE